ncbi:MAG TPA: hypothetical protein VMR23_15585 [Candidatus Limnocylindria bacterium]|nr:hypothetical protein [Candidatus Limnocylindria bacterium]
MRRDLEHHAVEPPAGRRLRRPGIIAVMPAALVLYAIVAGAGLYRWSSAVGAVIVAGLLWRRHPRARFAAYVLFSVMAVRGALVGDWATLTLALVAVAVMQTPAAARAWPRLRPGATRSDSDRMARP